MTNVLRFAAGLVGLSGLIITFLYGSSASEPDFLRRIILFFSTLTILTNTIVTIAFLIPPLAPDTKAGRFFSNVTVRTSIAGYITIVGIGYHLFLTPVSELEGMAQASTVITHYIVPLLFVLDWLFLTPGKSNLSWTTGGRSLVYPIIYTIWTLLHGAQTGWYPYPFVDVNVIGYPQAILNMAGFCLAFIILQLSFVSIGRFFGKKQFAQESFASR